MTGTTIAQAIPIAISPILTRLYTPKDFGVFALYVSVASIISVVATGRYELAIMLPKKDEDAVNIVALSVLISFFVSFVTLVLVSVFNTQITNLLGNPKISSWLYFVPVTVLLTGVYQSLNYWLNRKKRYRDLALTKVTQSGTSATANLGLGFGGFGSMGLIFGQILGQCVAVANLLRSKALHTGLFRYIKKSKIYQIAQEYKEYPKNSTIGALFNTLSYQAEIVLLGIFYSSYLLGLFYFVNKFVNIPKQFISSSIWQIFLSNASSSSAEVFNAMFSKQKKIILYSTVPMVYGIFIYSDLFVLVFGEGWRDATKFIVPLIMAMHINFIVASFSLFVIINKPKAEMLFNISLAVLKIVSILLSYALFDDIFYTVLSFSVVQFVMFYILGTWNYRQLGRGYLFFTKLYLPYFLTALLFLFLSHSFFLDSTITTKIGVYMLVVALYLGFMRYAKTPFN